MRKVFAVAALVLFAACAPTILTVAPTPSDRDMAVVMLEPGTGTIKGSALLRQRGGGVVTCAGNGVMLIPSTVSVSSQLKQMFGGEQGFFSRGGSTEFGGGKELAPIEPNRRTVCNAQGFFTFNNVRPGRWHIITSIIWTVSSEHQGGYLLATTEVTDGKEVEVVLSF